MQDINKVIERGTVINKYCPQTKNTPLTIITLSVPTTAKEIPNYPKFYFYGEMAEVANKFNIYDTVKVEGMIQSKKTVHDNKRFNSQIIIGNDIAESERTFSSVFEETEISGGKYLAPENMVRLVGTIKTVSKPSSSVSSVIIETVIDNRRSFVRCFAYNSLSETIISKFDVGMKVACIGEIQTLKKTKDDSPIYFENVVIKEIVPV